MEKILLSLQTLWSCDLFVLYLRLKVNIVSQLVAERLRARVTQLCTEQLELGRAYNRSNRGNSVGYTTQSLLLAKLATAAYYSLASCMPHLALSSWLSFGFVMLSWLCQTYNYVWLCLALSPWLVFNFVIVAVSLVCLAVSPFLMSLHMAPSPLYLRPMQLFRIWIFVSIVNGCQPHHYRTYNRSEAIGVGLEMEL